MESTAEKQSLVKSKSNQLTREISNLIDNIHTLKYRLSPVLKPKAEPSKADVKAEAKPERISEFLQVTSEEVSYASKLISEIKDRLEI